MSRRIEPEKIVEKYADKDFSTIELKAEPWEKQFITIYLECHNATAALLKVKPEMQRSMSYTRVLASNLVKKFGLKGKTRRTAYLAKKNLEPNCPEKVIRHVKDMYLSGELNESDLVSRMADLSESSTSDSTRFAATKELREWLKEAQSDIDANRLSTMEIVPLMISALADLPRDKYKAVLRGCRKRRMETIKERSIVFDADEMRRLEKEKMTKNGMNINDIDTGSGDTQTI
jgi:hypothetical protein